MSALIYVNSERERYILPPDGTRAAAKINNIALLFDGDSWLFQAQFVMSLKPVCELEAYCICSVRSGKAEPNCS